MPFNVSASSNSLKSSDFKWDTVGNKREDKADKSLAREESPAVGNSIPARKLGRPGRKRRQLPVDSSAPLVEAVDGPRSSPPRKPPAQMHNGDADATQNGVPKESVVPRKGSGDCCGERSPTERELEKNGEEAPHTPQRKRGRRKLEHPEKYVEEKDDDGSGETVKTEGGRGRLRGALGWEINLRQRPLQRITFQAGDPYYISKRTRDEWLAKWKMEDVLVCICS